MMENVHAGGFWPTGGLAAGPHGPPLYTLSLHGHRSALLRSVVTEPPCAGMNDLSRFVGRGISAIYFSEKVPEQRT